MTQSIHVISGLPRSGSTLLAAILRQNPALHAGMTSPLLSLVNAMQRAMSQENEGAPFITDVKREAVLRGVIEAYYADLAPGVTAIDTNRGWCAKLPLLSALYPDARIVACVRDVAWIMDSFERVIRANPFEPSRMHGYDAAGTVYSRIGGLASGDGAVGYALNALREAYYGGEARQLMLLTYETLTKNPTQAIEAVYEHFRVKLYAHNFESISFNADDFDKRMGTPGLHRIAPRVRAAERKTILPPALFASFAGDTFWRDAPNPHSVKVL